MFSSVLHSISNLRFVGRSVLIKVAVPPPLFVRSLLCPDWDYPRNSPRSRARSNQLQTGNLSVESIVVYQIVVLLSPLTYSSFISSNLYLIILLRWQIRKFLVYFFPTYLRSQNMLFTFFTSGEGVMKACSKGNNCQLFCSFSK